MDRSKFQLSLILMTLCLVFGNPRKVIGQTDDIANRYFFKGDSTWLVVDNNIDHNFTFELKADTLYQDENGMIIYDNKRIMQINVIPIQRFLPNSKSGTIEEALKVHKKWELKYQQEVLGTKLKSGEEFYYYDSKPFLIWWHKNPPQGEDNTMAKDGKMFDTETATFVDVETYDVTHMLCLSFTLYGLQTVAISIPLYEGENMQVEMEKLKAVARSVRHYGANIDMDVLSGIQKSKQNYVLRDKLNYLELEVPEWLNVTTTNYKNAISAAFPAKFEVVNAMIMYWEYKSDSLTFDDFKKRTKSPRASRPNYGLIEDSDSTLRYFYTCEDNWFYSQDVYLNGTDIMCFINFTATRNTYDYNAWRFEEIVSKIKLK